MKQRNKLARREAMAAGLKRYFSGIPCPHGHVSERKTRDGGCVECARMARIEWGKRNREYINSKATIRRKANPEKQRERKRREYVRHKDAIKARVQAWYAKNKERAKETRAAWSEKNRAAIKARRQKNAAVRKAQLAAWRVANPLARRVHEARRRARAKASGGRFTQGDVDRLLKKQRGRCPCCATVLRDFHVDHIVPLAKGGRNDAANIQLLCQPCNQAKAARDPILFMQSLGRLL